MPSSAVSFVMKTLRSRTAVWTAHATFAQTAAEYMHEFLHYPNTPLPHWRTSVRREVTLKTIAKDIGPRCPKHKGEVLRFYCETCQVLICRDCTVVDHRHPEHQYIDSAEASLKYKKAMKDTLPVCHTEIKELEESLAASSRAQQEFRDKS